MLPSTIERTEFIDEGAGERCIVLLHGWCCRTGDFMPLVERLRTHHRVVVPDWGVRAQQRGGVVDFSEIAADLIASLGERGVRDPLLCGHSQGGFLAAWLAKEHAFPMRGLLALETILPVTRKLARGFLDWIPFLNRDSIQEFWNETLHDAFFVESESGPLVDSISRGMMAQSLDFAQNLLNANCAIDLDQSLAKVTVPVHLVKAQRTPINLETLHSVIPQATCESIADAGHFIMVFHADRVVGAINRMVDENAT